MEPVWGWRAGEDAFGAPPSFGRGLLRESLSAVVEEEGVDSGDWAASRELPEGDEVPSFDSLFLDFEDLFGSLARESCSCWKC